MIYDKIENIDKYFAVSADFGAGLELAKKLTADKFEAKRYDASENVYAFESEYAPVGDSGSVFENHHEKIDVQIVLCGDEDFDFAYSAGVTQPYSPDNDAEFGTAEEFSSLRLRPGYFVAVFPGEWHRPGKKNAQSSSVKKLVVKIKA